MPNTCWNCKHNILKLKVLVPHDRTIREYVHRTGDFQSEIVAVVKEKHGQYAVSFRSGSDVRLLSFKMLHICKLKLEENKQHCANFTLNEEHSYISNIIYSKQPTPELNKKEPVALTTTCASALDEEECQLTCYQ